MSLAGQPSGQLVAVVRTADRIDYWIRRRVHATDLDPSRACTHKRGHRPNVRFRSNCGHGPPHRSDHLAAFDPKRRSDVLLRAFEHDLCSPSGTRR